MNTQEIDNKLTEEEVIRELKEINRILQDENYALKKNIEKLEKIIRDCINLILSLLFPGESKKLENIEKILGKEI